MGARPDGIVQCDCCGIGVLEVKCPFLCADKSIQSVTIENRNFFLHEDDEGMLTLKQNHAYFLPGANGDEFTDAQYSDFIVWRDNEPFIQRILLDSILLMKQLLRQRCL